MTANYRDRLHLRRIERQYALVILQQDNALLFNMLRDIKAVLYIDNALLNWIVNDP